MGEVQRFTNCTTGGPVFVDVKDGKIVRLTPLEFDDTDAPSWIIEARGQKFTPPRKALVSPWTDRPSLHRLLAQADPHAAQARGLRPQGRPQHPEPRHLRLRAHQLGRGLRHGGRGDHPGQTRVRALRHLHSAQLPPDVGQRRLPVQLLPALPQRGRHDLHRAQPGQLGGLAVGRRPHVGQHPSPGEPRGLRPARGRAQEHRDDRLLVVRPRHHSGRGLRGLRVAAAAPLAQETWA